MYRLPLAVRIYAGLFLLVWFGLLLVFTIKAISNGNPGTVVATVGMAVFGGLIIWRMYGLALIATPEELVLRNNFTTQRIPRAQIEGFRIGSGGVAMPFGHTLNVLFTNGTLTPVDAMIWSGFGPGGEARLAACAGELRSWLSGSGPPPKPTRPHK